MADEMTVGETTYRHDAPPGPGRAGPEKEVRTDGPKKSKGCPRGTLFFVMR